MKAITQHHMLFSSYFALYVTMQQNKTNRNVSRGFQGA